MTITQVRKRAGHSFNTAMAHGGEFAGEARVHVADALDHLPEAVDLARTGAIETTTTLQTMGDPTLQLLAAASVGCATGLYLAGSPRVMTLAAIAPAVIVGVAILTRPGRQHPR